MGKTLLKSSLIALAGVGLIAGSANAYSFDMGPGSYVDGPAFSDPGLVMKAQINPGLDAITFDLLSPGNSYSFLFASFWTEETAVNGDDTVPQALTAHVEFDTPDLFGGVTGTSVGTSSFFGFFQGWNLTWDDPVTVNFGSGGQFLLSLSDASFGTKWWQGPDGPALSCREGFYGANVYGTVTLVNDPVPEPATILLFGAGLAGLAGFSRRRKK